MKNKMDKNQFLTKGFLFLAILFIISWWLDISGKGFFWRELSSFQGLLMLGAIVGCFSFLPSKLAKILCASLISLFAVIFIIDLFCFINFGVQLNNLMLSTALQSSVNETSEFLSTYLTLDFILWLLLFVILSFLYFWFFYPRGFHQRWFVGLALIGGCVWLYEGNRFVENQYSCRHRQNLYSLSPLRYGCEMMMVRENLRDSFNQYIQEAQQKSMHTPPPLEDIDQVVLILGESTQRGHMQIYGYSRPTTPNLLKLQKDGNLFIFSDVISPHAHTDISLQKILTFANLDSQTQWNQEQNLISIFKNVGYKTLWISNQERRGVWGDTATVFSLLSDETFFGTRFGAYASEIGFDESVLPYVGKDLSHKTLSIIHLMGAHATYHKRYPKSYQVFSDLSFKKSERVRANYDNAILYNDYIVSEIFKRFSDRDAIVIYVSDHGEEVFDHYDFSGHNEAKINRFMVEIPMMVYVSELFKQKHPKLFERIKTSLNRPYITDDLIHTILDIAGIKIFDPTRSVIDSHFNPNRKRIVGGKDYDKELKSLPVKTVE